MLGDRIRLKRLAAGLSLQDLADRLEASGTVLTRAALSNYETNKTTPNAKILWALAKELEVSTDFFFAEKQAEVQLVGFRKKSNVSAKRVDEIIAGVKIEIERRIELDGLLGISPPNAPPFQMEVKTPDQAEEAAAAVRKKWNLGSQPIASVTGLLEEHGWYIIEFPDDPDLDGVAGFVEDTRRPFAVSRTGVPIDRKRFTLLHEAGHAFLSVTNDELVEKAAHRFAAAFLLPKERVFEELGKARSSVTLEELRLVKHKYGISLQAILFRLRDLSVISDGYFKLFFTYMSREGIRKYEPCSKDLKFEESPMSFKKNVYRALADGLISLSKAEQYLPGLEAQGASASMKRIRDLREILALPTAERSKILESAAESAASYYEKSDDNLSNLVEDVHDYP